MAGGSNVDGTMIKELYQPVEPKSHRPSYANKAVILSSTKWDQMWKKVTNPADKETEVLCQQEREFREYLRHGSKKMTSSWENTVQNIRDKKEAERLRRDKAKIEEGKRPPRYQPAYRVMLVCVCYRHRSALLPGAEGGR